MKAKLFLISPQVLVAMLTQSAEYKFKVKAGIPQDARIFSSGYEPSKHAFYIGVESESFQDIPDGCEIPIAEPPTVQQLN